MALFLHPIVYYSTHFPGLGPRSTCKSLTCEAFNQLLVWDTKLLNQVDGFLQTEVLLAC